MGTAAVQGELWGARARDWAEINEPAWNPVFEHVLSVAGVGPGKSYLDIGCGSGGALVLANGLGADVAGVDAAGNLVAEARRRLPDARIEVGDMEELPFADAAFDAVSGINAFQFAGDAVRALAEARRVCRKGGTVAVLVWGDRDKCQLQQVALGAIGPLLPPSPPPSGPPFGKAGVIEEFMEKAGLKPGDSGFLDAVTRWDNAGLALRALVSAGVAVRAERHSGAEAVASAVAEALAPHVAADGTVRLSNQFRWVTARPA